MRQFLLAAGLSLLGAVSASAQINPLLYGLEAYYPFQGNAQDVIGSAHGTVYGGSTLVNDRNSYTQDAYLFDGQSGYIDLGNNLDHVFARPGAQFAIAAWVKLNDASATWSNNRLIINKSGDSGCPENQREFYFRYLAGEFNFSFAGLDGSWARYVNTSYPVNDTIWHHMVLLYDANNSGNDGLDRVQFYVDGLPQTSRLLPNSFGPLGHIQAGTAHLGIGNRLSSTGQACPTLDVPGFFKGSIDDVAIYSRLLTRQEVAIIASPLRHGLPLAVPNDKIIAGLFIYPTVTIDGNFNVQLPHDYQRLDYKVFNALGQIVQRGIVTPSTTSITLNKAKGIYNILLSNESRTSSQQVVVE